MPHELILIIAYFFVTGIVVGILSMIFGIGGGLIIVPAVSVFLHAMGYPHNKTMKIAVATSLVTIMVSTLNVLYKQNKARNVPWHLIRQFLPFLIVGALIGSLLSSIVPGIFLTYLFLAFLLYIIISSFLNKEFTASYQWKDFTMPSKMSRRIIAFLAGCVSILIGVGGNVLFIPYLRNYKLPMKNATAFTVGIMPILTFIGSLGYLVQNLHFNEKTMPPYSFGYVNIPAFLFIIPGSFLGVFFGQKLLAYINDKAQAVFYLIFLIIIFFIMLSLALRATP